MSLGRRLAPALSLLAFIIASPALGQPAHLLRDIAAGRERFSADANPNSLTAFGAKVAFVASEERIGTEVWVTDSEARRTSTLGDICRGYCNDGPEIVGALGPTLFFLEARSLAAERLLWASDGTPKGTHPVLDGAEVLAYAMLPDRLVFLAGSPVKLWRIDGTASAATEIASVTDFQYVLGFSVSGSRAFLLLRNSVSKLPLWVTDGTTAGTRKLAEVPIGNPAPELLAATATHFFFFTATSAGQELWASDGTAAGTRAVSSFEALEPFGITHWLKPIGKYVYFLADDITHGHELWRSDGTPQGTTRVSDFGYAFPFEDIYEQDQVEELGGKVYFFATDGFGPLHLWTSNGSPASTKSLSGVCDDPCYLDDQPWLRRLGNRLFFPVGYGELWFTDGTAAGSGPLISSCPNACVTRTSRPLLLGDRLYFVASGPSDRELWSSDGTRAGTHEVTHFEDWDAFEDNGPPYLTPEVVAAGGRLWFAAAQHPYGLELWSSTGAPETTELAADIARGAASSSPANFAALGGRVLFTAALCDDGRQDVFASDGVSTQRVSGFVTECYYGLDGEQPIVASGPYGYFWEGTYDLVLWRTDGTAGGTIQLASFTDGYYAPPLLPVDGGVAFVIQDGLWRSDGTVAGTVKKADLPGFPEAAFGDGQGVYLIAAEQSASAQVWRADLGSGAVVPLTTFGANDRLSL
ncbi:MAG TPA: hypothetical protein VN923_00570, partial [Thermoanaerobaculia bacterium]|nr:hypothetical protein [Thermoanaerobaculia bacterium]